MHFVDSNMVVGFACSSNLHASPAVIIVSALVCITNGTFKQSHSWPACTVAALESGGLCKYIPPVPPAAPSLALSQCKQIDRARPYAHVGVYIYRPAMSDTFCFCYQLIYYSRMRTNFHVWTKAAQTAVSKTCGVVRIRSCKPTH